MLENMFMVLRYGKNKEYGKIKNAAHQWSSFYVYGTLKNILCILFSTIRFVRSYLMRKQRKYILYNASLSKVLILNLFKQKILSIPMNMIKVKIL